jgi:phosphatidylglycerol---prolipoprotein diacylglyceryl transferase
MLTIFLNLFSPPRHMILLVIAAWIGLTLAETRTERHGVSRENLNNLIFYALLAFILGGRISFILQHLTAFTKSPSSIFSINPDLFDILGALVAAILASMVLGQRNQLSFWPTLDALTPFFAILTIGLGLTHLAAGTAFGLPTKLPWSMELWNAERHPSQIYETLAAALIFCLLWFKRHDSRPGLLFLMYSALTAGSIVFLSAFRGDLTLVFNGIKQEQLFALAFLAASFVLFEWRFNQLQKVEKQPLASEYQK